MNPRRRSRKGDVDDDDDVGRSSAVILQLLEEDATTTDAARGEQTKVPSIGAAVLACAAVLCIMSEPVGAYSFHRQQRSASASSIFHRVAAGRGISHLQHVGRRAPLSLSSSPAFVSTVNRRAQGSKLFLSASIEEEDDKIYEDEEEEYEEEYEQDEEEDVKVQGSDYIEDAYVPLEADPDDPNYNAQKELLEESLPRLQALAAYKKFMRDQVEVDGVTEAWDKTLNEFFQEHLTKEELAEVEEKAKQYEITSKDIEGLTDEDIEEATKEISNLEGEDAFPPNGPVLESTGITNDMLVSIDSATKEYYAQKKAIEDAQGFSAYDTLDYQAETERLNNEDPVQLEEIHQVINEMEEDDRPMYGYQLLIYDLQFNMTNIFLAACKHNPEAPIILPQWLYQLEVYERYADGQERNFEFTWDEADSADMSELEKYWKGLGYDEIPTRTENETNIITVEPPDDDEIQMSHMQEWMKEVYDPESDEVFFDDDNFMPYDSVYDEDYYQKDPPKDQVELAEMLAEIKQDVEDGEATEEEAKEVMDYYDGLVSIQNLTERVKFGTPESAEFQGRLVVACSATDEDLEIAEKITKRFEAEFGLKIFVETRVYGHAKPEDFLFEVWLESYDIDLLHSKRKATLSSQTWDGPPFCDDAQIDFLVQEVGYLISDEHRYSYRIFEYEGIEEG